MVTISIDNSTNLAYITLESPNIGTASITINGELQNYTDGSKCALVCCIRTDSKQYI